MSIQQPLRVVVWSTGGVGKVAIDAVNRRPNLELVGVWVHSADKVGRDAGELAGGDPLGVAATDDAEALIACKPDCVVYAASGPERDGAAVPDYLRLLAAGINVVSTSSTSLVHPPSYFARTGATSSRRRPPQAAPRSTRRASFPASPPISSRC